MLRRESKRFFWMKMEENMFYLMLVAVKGLRDTWRMP